MCANTTIERLLVQLTTFVFPLKLTVRKEIVTKATSTVLIKRM